MTRSIKLRPDEQIMITEADDGEIMITTQKKRKISPSSLANLRPIPHPEALGVIPLSDGEESKPLRVRGPRELFEKIKASQMTPVDIGGILGRYFEG